jgi:hypothetical protein
VLAGALDPPPHRERVDEPRISLGIAGPVAPNGWYEELAEIELIERRSL